MAQQHDIALHLLVQKHILYCNEQRTFIIRNKLNLKSQRRIKTTTCNPRHLQFWLLSSYTLHCCQCYRYFVILSKILVHTYTTVLFFQKLSEVISSIMVKIEMVKIVYVKMGNIFAIYKLKTICLLDTLLMFIGTKL